jgi:2-phosphoglycerate kinase
MTAPWIVTLLCGASGVGKSRVARPLAERYGVPLAEADDIVTALQAITTLEQQPMLHFWETHPEFRSWTPERIAARHFEVAGASSRVRGGHRRPCRVRGAGGLRGRLSPP